MFNCFDSLKTKSHFLFIKQDYGSLEYTQKKSCKLTHIQSIHTPTQTLSHQAHPSQRRYYPALYLVCETAPEKNKKNNNKNKTKNKQNISPVSYKTE